MSQAPPVPPHMQRSVFDLGPDLALLRAEAPVSLVEAPMGPVRLPAWLITRYEDVREVLGDATRFSNSSKAMVDRVAAVTGADVGAKAPSAGQVSPSPPCCAGSRRCAWPYRSRRYGSAARSRCTA